MSIEIPAVGKIESDSGSHIYDLFSIIFIIGILYIGKKLVDRIIK